MVPGYTGYIPRMPFHFGDTYKKDCDTCLDEYFSARDSEESKIKSLRRAVRSNQSLRPRYADAVIRDHLNIYTDVERDPRRTPTEPHIAGYQGFVPRVYSTDRGLGCRYQVMTNKALTLFNQEADICRSVQNKPIQLNSSAPTGKSVPHTQDARRLYTHDGMVPDYTGHVPHLLHYMGDTYGESTRKLQVCSHNNANFGDFMNTKPRKQVPIETEWVPSARHLAQFSRRLYKEGGMVPNYTGHVPDFYNQMANTFGHTTRNLEVCTHDKPNFGRHMLAKSLA